MAVKPSSNIEQLVEIKESLDEFVLIARVLRGDEVDPLELPDHTRVGRVCKAICVLERALNPQRRAFTDRRRGELRRYGWPYDSHVVQRSLSFLQPLRELVDDLLVGWKLTPLCEHDGYLIGPGKASMDGPGAKGTVVINAGRKWPPAIDGGILHVMEGIQFVLTEFLEQKQGKAISDDDYDSLPKDGSRESYFLRALWKLKAINKGSRISTEKAFEELEAGKGEDYAALIDRKVVDALENALERDPDLQAVSMEDRSVVPPEVEPVERRSKRRTKKQIEVLIAQALLLVRDKPYLPDSSIACEAGIDPTQLSRSVVYKKAARLARDVGRKPAKGSYNPRTNEMEAGDR